MACCRLHGRNCTQAADWWSWGGGGGCGGHGRAQLRLLLLHTLRLPLLPYMSHWRRGWQPSGMPSAARGWRQALQGSRVQQAGQGHSQGRQVCEQAQQPRLAELRQGM